MNLTTLVSAAGPTLHKVLNKTSKYAPEILTGVGVVGSIGALFLAAKASTKLEPIITNHETRVAQTKSVAELTDLDSGDRLYTDGEIQRDLVRVYGRTVWELTKLYGPAVTLEIGSIVSILAAHGIMHRRAVTLLGAYKALESSFAAYRDRVVEEIGEEKERDIRLGYKTETIVDEETGKKKKVRTLSDPSKVGLYSLWFDEGNPNWTTIPFENLAFLKNAQNYLNDRLRIHGYLYLSSVYEYLGFDTADHPEAQIVGWVIDANGVGDNHVDFDLYNADNRDFINGIAPGVLLDFNVDGVILDKVGTFAKRQKLGLPQYNRPAILS